MTFDEMMEELKREDQEYWEEVEKGAKAFLADEEADKFKELCGEQGRCPPDYNSGFCYENADCSACWEQWRNEHGEDA